MTHWDAVNELIERAYELTNDDSERAITYLMSGALLLAVQVTHKTDFLNVVSQQFDSTLDFLQSDRLQ